MNALTLPRFMNPSETPSRSSPGAASLAATPARTSPGPVPATGTPPPIAILGVPFDNVTTAGTIERIAGMIASRQAHYAATANVDFVVQALEDAELRRILIDAHLVLADGMPLVWASRWLGNPLPERVTGSDLVPRLLGEAEQRGWRVFLLGGTEASVATAAEKTRSRHPRLELVGAYSPPFRPLLDMDHQEIIQRIRMARPDILLVAFGCPKQEKWINMHYRSLGVPLSIGVGATIDFLAGTMTRAPRWMQRTGLEWIYRLLQEPRRLFRRYAADLGVFGTAILRQWWQLRSRTAAPPSRAVLGAANDAEPGYRYVRISPALDAATVARHHAEWSQAMASGCHLFLDLGQIESIDSTGVASLIRLQNQATASGRQLIVLAPSPAVCNALALMRLTGSFATAADIDAARAMLAQRLAELPVTQTTPEEPLHWQGEVVAANADAVWQATEAYLQHQVGRPGAARVDLAGLRFLDSTGVSVMVRARKFGRQHGLEVRFLEPTATVRQVIKRLRLEEALLGKAG